MTDEETCSNCLGSNPTWSADNPLWNRVMPDEGGFLCTNCFIQHFEQSTGTRPVWRLTQWQPGTSLEDK